MRRNLLVQLTIAILLPYICGFLIAWMGFYQFERTMENVAASYAQNLAHSVVARLETSQWDTYTDADVPPRPKQARSRIVGINETILTGINVPGLFAVFDSAGSMLYGPREAKVLSSADTVPAEDESSVRRVSGPDGRTYMISVGNMLNVPEEAKVLATALVNSASDGDTQKINGLNGRIYTVSVYPLPHRGVTVVAAVAWNDLLGPMVSLSTLWPFITGLLGLIGIFTVYIMWQKVILPLKDLEQEISSMKWGEDVPLTTAPEAVEELKKLRKAIVALSNSAIEKARLSRRYVNDLVRVQEDEREMISREIHDGPLQDITALVQRLRLIADSGNSENDRLRLIHEAEKIAMTGVRDLREICNGLTPPWLDLGLAQALIELSERLSQQLKVKISLDLQDIDDLPGNAKLAFFRVAQEAVNNSVQHGKAENVRIYLKEEGEVVVMRIEDDGEGFAVPDDVAELRVVGHRGLSNMMERMSLCGGSIIIDSKPGKGTIIQCELPIKPAGQPQR